MADISDELETMTLSERLKKADYLSRELSEHMRQACIPKMTGLVRASREYDPSVVSDQQILDRTLEVLQANEFADGLYNQLRQVLDSIRDEMQPLLFAQESMSASGMHRALDFDPDDMTD